MPSEPPQLFVRCSSHRARSRLFQAIPRRLQGYFSLHRDLRTGGVYAVTAEELPVARKVKGVTLVRKPEQYHFMRCWASLPDPTRQRPDKYQEFYYPARGARGR